MSDTTPTPAAPETAPAPSQEKEQEQEQERTFTQADLDRIVEERLARERKKYADYDDVKAKAAALDEKEAENATDLERAVAQARKETEEALRKEFAAERVAARIEVTAAGKFADTEDARLRLGSRIDEFISDDGEVDTEAISAALTDVLEKHPHLAAKETPKAPSASEAGMGKRPAAPADVSPGYDRLRAAYSSGDN